MSQVLSHYNSLNLSQFSDGWLDRLPIPMKPPSDLLAKDGLFSAIFALILRYCQAI